MAAASLQIRESLATLQWDAPRAIDSDKVAAVRAALVADQGKVPAATDPYFFGKQVRAPMNVYVVEPRVREGRRRCLRKGQARVLQYKK